jgi:hypothetical protein
VLAHAYALRQASREGRKASIGRTSDVESTQPPGGRRRPSCMESTLNGNR